MYTFPESLNVYEFPLFPQAHGFPDQIRSGSLFRLDRIPRNELPLDIFRNNYDFLPTNQRQNDAAFSYFVSWILQPLYAFNSMSGL